MRKDIAHQPVTDLFETVDESIAVGPLTLTIDRPVSAEDLIDEDEFDDDERLPYWADLWPSGRVLADEIATRDLTGRRIVELGAGLGLPSLCAAIGGADVTATDWYAPAVAFIRHNADRNGAPLRALEVDWRDPPAALMQTPFDLVIAADVLYETRNVEPLATLIPRLCANDGEVLIADPRRNDASALLERLSGAGWTISRRDVEFTGRRDESGSTIHLHLLTPPGVQ